MSASLAGLALVSAGCGDDSGFATRYPVTGTVKYKGELVKKASINFIPNEVEGHPAGGQIENGTFTLTTAKPGDGALVGKYKVTVDDRELDSGEMRAAADAAAKKKGQPAYGAIPQDIQVNALKKMKSGIPGKYQIASTSDIELEVKPQANKFDIELKD
jgi:hypothetical protein